MSESLPRARVVGDLVYLRPFEREDIDDDYLDWINDTRANRYIVGAGFPVTRDDLARYYDSHGTNSVLLAICDKESNTRIGNARLSQIDWIHRVATYGRLLGHPDYQSKGYGSDSLIQLLRFGFHNLGLNRIYSSAVASNTASLLSNEKVGMVQEGVLREYLFLNGRFHDTIMLSMLRSDFDRIHGTPEVWLKRDGMIDQSGDSTRTKKKRD